jgi:transcription elongation factor GreA
MTKIDEARQLAADREFGKLEDIWTGLITEKETMPAALFVVTDLINEAGEVDRACLLLDILSEHYETTRHYDHSIEVQKHMLRYRKEDEGIRKKLIGLYRKKYVGSAHIEDYLEHSGMSTGEPIMKAIDKLEEYLKYDVDNYFFFERYGIGKVVETKPRQREIVVDFERKKKHFLAIDVARGLLTPVHEDHFLYKKSKNIDDLKSLAKAEPERLLVMLLQSFSEPLSATQIKGHLEGIIEKPDLNKFWEKIRKRMENHDNIRVTGRTSKTYAYVASRKDKQDQAVEAFHKAGIRHKYELAEEYARKVPDTFAAILPHLVKLGNDKKSEHPGVALDILMLVQELGQPVKPGYSTDDILSASNMETILNDMMNHEHQQRLLNMLKEGMAGDWAAAASKLFFEIEDFRLLDALVNGLSGTPQNLDDIYRRILAMPKQHPKQFHWMLKRMATGKLSEYMNPAVLPKLIDSMEYVRGIKAVMKGMLSLINFDAIMAQAQVLDASRIHDAVNRSNILTGHEKRSLVQIIEHHFPEFIKEESDTIYTTAQALKKKKEELEHIVTVEIPENRKEIGRAREFGDLSENFEYKAAKEKQDQLFAKARIIESELQRVQLIESSKVKTDRVEIGTAVTLERTDNASLLTYRILGRWDTDLRNNIISNEAPLAQSMLGKHIGDLITIESIEYKISEITSAL